jgi:hypothetical protein
MGSSEDRGATDNLQRWSACCGPTGLLWNSHHQTCLSRRPRFRSWNWDGWRGRIEYHRCLVDWDRYANEEERSHVPKKRKCISEGGHVLVRNDRAFIRPDTRTDNLPGQGLKVSSTMARFKMKKIHTQEPLETAQIKKKLPLVISGLYLIVSIND